MNKPALVDLLRRELLRQLGGTGMDGGGMVGIDSTQGYDGEANIDCYQLADVIIEAIRP